MVCRTKPRLRSRRADNPRGDFASNITPTEKSSGNDKYRTGAGSLVAREGPAAHECWRRRVYQLVRADGPRGRAAGERAFVGSDNIPQELDPGALCRPCSDLLPGRD